jgi:gamma-glutamylcysteine synthetase
MNIRMALATAVVLGAIAAPLRAQDTTTKKPGGLNKVAHNVSKTMKKAGRDTKAEVHRDASKTHQTLTKAGNETKAELKRTTGVTTHSPDPNHKPGGVNKLARDVSHTSKTVGAKAKHGVKSAAGDVHQDLTKAGKHAKEVVKDSVKKP